MVVSSWSDSWRRHGFVAGEHSSEVLLLLLRRRGTVWRILGQHDLEDRVQQLSATTRLMRRSGFAIVRRSL